MVSSTLSHSPRSGCEQELLKKLPGLERLSVDRLLLDGLRARAAEDEVDWRVVLQADAAPSGSEDFCHLREMIAEVLPPIVAAESFGDLGKTTCKRLPPPISQSSP